MATLLALVVGCGTSSSPEGDNTGSAWVVGTVSQSLSATDVTRVLVYDQGFEDLDGHLWNLVWMAPQT